MKTSLSTGYRYPFAFVAFGGHPSLWWMHFLKKGFYHCLLVLGNGREWIVIDPLRHYTDLILLKHIAIRDFFREKGYRLVNATPTVPKLSPARFRPCTCVETVKRFLGIETPFLFTPYQLFCHLTSKKGKFSLTKEKKCDIVGFS